jgi:hypothetical protein
MDKVNKDIQALAELKERLNPKVEVSVPKEILEDICKYCEREAIYDKLGNYGDFYYKVKKILEN